MNRFTRSDVQASAGLAAIIGAALVAGMIYTDRTLTLQWDNAPGAPATGVESTTDFETWQPYCVVTNTNTVTIRLTNTHQFFRVFHRVKWDGPIFWNYY